MKPAERQEHEVQCWEARQCGRENGGSKAKELGVCPAYAQQAGDACWMVAGTFGGGVVHGTFAEKQTSCMACSHYRSYDMKHRSQVHLKYNRG